MDLKALNFYSGTKSSKSLIVSILSEEFPLTIKQIFSEVKRQGINISYQGVHKSLLELIEHGIVEKTGKKFRLSKRWIDELSSFSKRLKGIYAGEEAVNYKSQENIQLSFNTLKDFDKFFIFDYFNFPNSIKKPVVAHWFHMYSLIGLSEDDILGLKELVSGTDFFILCSGKTALDRFFGETFKNLGCKIRYGVKNDPNSDYLVFGDYLLQAYWPQKTKEAIKKIFKVKNIEEFKLSSLLEIMYEETEPIHVIINKNPALTEKIREDSLKRFRN